MDSELKLGFHRLGRWFEDEVNLGVAMVIAWAVTVWLISIAAALSVTTAALLIAAGAALTLLARSWIADLARGWRRGRMQLERERGRHAG